MRKLSSFDVYHLSDLVNKLNKIKEILPKLWKHVLLYDPAMDKKTKEKTIKYANVNYWISLNEKRNRSYHYHLKKLNKIIANNTYGTQAQIKKTMIETLDALV